MTSILVMKKRRYFVLRRVYSSWRNGDILYYDEYARHEDTAIFCITTSILVMRKGGQNETVVLLKLNSVMTIRHTPHSTSILVMKKRRYFVLRRVYSSCVKKEKIKQLFRCNLILCYDSHAHSAFDEYTRYRVLFATRFRYTLFEQVATADWLMARVTLFTRNRFVVGLSPIAFSLSRLSLRWTIGISSLRFSLRTHRFLATRSAYFVGRKRLLGLLYFSCKILTKSALFLHTFVYFVERHNEELLQIDCNINVERSMKFMLHSYF